MNKIEQLKKELEAAEKEEIAKIEAKKQALSRDEIERRLADAAARREEANRLERGIKAPATLVVETILGVQIRRNINTGSIAAMVDRHFVPLDALVRLVHPLVFASLIHNATLEKNLTVSMLTELNAQFAQNAEMLRKARTDLHELQARAQIEAQEAKKKVAKKIAVKKIEKEDEEDEEDESAPSKLEATLAALVAQQAQQQQALALLMARLAPPAPATAQSAPETAPAQSAT